MYNVYNAVLNRNKYSFIHSANNTKIIYLSRNPSTDNYWIKLVHQQARRHQVQGLIYVARDLDVPLTASHAAGHLNMLEEPSSKE